jgi:hypothetical protein
MPRTLYDIPNTGEKVRVMENEDKLVKYFVALTFVVFVIVNIIPAALIGFSTGRIEANLLSEIDAIKEDPQVHLKNTQFQKGSTYLLTGKTYETSQNYDYLRSYWVQEFTRLGWKLNNEREIILFGYKFGEKILVFTKGDYYATLGFEINGADTLQSVNLDVRWDMFWRINNYLYLLIITDFGLLGLYWLLNGGKRREATATDNKWWNGIVVRIFNTSFYKPTIRVLGLIIFIFAVLSSYVWISLFV